MTHPCGCQRPSRLVHHHVGPFRNPVTQAIGGSEFNASQRLVLPGRVFAIAIAADSQVSECDVYVGHNNSPTERIRVSEAAPFVGFIDPDVSPILWIVPVRAHDRIDSVTYIDEVSAEQFPRLRLAFYTDAPPVQVPTARAPIFGQWAADGVTTAPSWVLPVAGRHECVSISWLTENYAGGCTTVVPTALAYGYALTAAGVLTPIAETLALTTVASGTVGQRHWTAAGAISGASIRDGSLTWANVLFTLTPDAGTFSYRARMAAR